jgi:hypothetical protein
VFHTSRSRECSADLPPELFDSAPDALVAVSAGGVITPLSLREVASTTTADVVDGCCIFLADTLAGELLVEAEYGTLGAGVHVAGATAAARVDAARRLVAMGRDGAAGGSSRSALGRVDAAVVASATTATVDVVGGRDGRKRLSDGVAHGDCLEVGLRCFFYMLG